MFLRTITDAVIGLALFLAFAVAIGNYQRVSDAANRLGDILSVNSSTGSFLEFSLNDSPLIAAVVATVVPAQHTGAVTEIRQSDPNTAFLLLGGIFSALMALNLAFIRHLRREYASPRRGAWRGGGGSVENP
ncbi:MAG: hypothetical protein ACTSSR_03005 [Alphaproteobacteria bacterium]|jgi:hypothetical protein